MYSAENLNAINASGSINLVSTNQAVSVNSQETNNAVHSAQGALNLWHSSVVYDAVNLSFVVNSAADIKSSGNVGSSGAINAAGQVQGTHQLSQETIGVIIPSQGGIGIVETNLNITNLINSQGLQRILSTPVYNSMFDAAGNYSAIGSVGMNFVDVVEAVNNDLGSIVIQ